MSSPTFLAAACYTHLVQISAPGIKRFTPVFIDAVKALNKVKFLFKKILHFCIVKNILSKASDESGAKRLSAFKSFVGEFGTHYSSITLMGAKYEQLLTIVFSFKKSHIVFPHRLVAETRFSRGEATDLGEEGMSGCNSK